MSILIKKCTKMLIDTKNPQGIYSKFSPDGKKIAFLPSILVLFSSSGVL
ncbi:MAG: hypothetical protein U0354_04150 [Candidatus Sericytochromatia bacterium]